MKLNAKNRAIVVLSFPDFLLNSAQLNAKNRTIFTTSKFVRVEMHFIRKATEFTKLLKMLKSSLDASGSF